jgi:signal transduction histidine kinase
LINLFDNAVAAMDGKGTITVQTKENMEDGLVTLHVIDTGGGIENKVHSQLFEPYFSTKLKGTGLGLAIVQKIMLDHGGNVKAISHATRGSEFVLEFPNLIKNHLPSEQHLWS